MFAFGSVRLISFATVMFVPPAVVEVMIDDAAGQPEHANRENG